MRALLFVFLIISMLMLSCEDYGDSTAPLSPQATDHLMQEGDSLFSADNYEEAIVKYQECLTACRTRKDTTGMSDCYFQLSTIYQRLGNISMSIEMAKECLHLDSLTNKAENLSSTYNTLAALYYSSKDIASARKFINLAIELEKKTEHQENMASRYGLASEIYTKSDSAARGLLFAKQAYKLDSLAADTSSMGKRLCQMGDAYCALGEYTSAERTYHQAERFLLQSHNTYSLCITYKQLGNLYQQTGEKQKAIEYYEKSVDLARAYKMNFLLEFGVSRLSSLYMDHNQARGLMYAQEAMELKDSIYNEKTQLVGQQFSAQYDLFNKEKKISEQENRIKVQKTMILAIFSFLILVLSVIGFYAYIRNMRRKKMELHHKYYHALTRDEDQSDSDRIESFNDSSIQSTESDRQFILKVDEIIKENIDVTALSSVLISDRICLGQRQLNRKMKAITGVDTGTYIRQKRLAKAKLMLKDSTVTIGDVQTACGFDSPSYFSRVFKEEIGMTPSEFRKSS